MMMRNSGGRWGYVAKACIGAPRRLSSLCLALVLPWCMPVSAPAQNSKPISFTRRLAFCSGGDAGARPMAHGKFLTRLPGWYAALGTAARPRFSPWLYILIAAMIGSGWLMVSASPLPFPTHLPGGFIVPNLTGPNALLEARSKFIHEVVSKLLIAAIGVHIAAALKHHFVDKDGVLQRMLPFYHGDKGA